MPPRKPWIPYRETTPKTQPWRKVTRFRRAPEIPEGMIYILDCQHEVPKPSPDSLDIQCPFCPGEAPGRGE